MILISTDRLSGTEQREHAHSLLSRCLKEHGVDYAMGQTPIVLGEHGKPSLAARPELHYNISHADGIAAAMVSEHECGIDCERIRTCRPRVLRRAYSEAERKAVEAAASDSERDRLFFSLWTLKEAYVKATGVGLSFPLREAEFVIEGERILTDLSGCFSLYVIDGGYVAAVCKLSDKGGPHRVFELQTTNAQIVI